MVENTLNEASLVSPEIDTLPKLLEEFCKQQKPSAHLERHVFIYLERIFAEEFRNWYIKDQ